MERRWTTRTELDLDVEVAVEDGGVFQARTRDIGLGGVFVRTAGDPDLEPGDDVELVFRLPGETGDGPFPDPEEGQYRIRARVVRLTPVGAGLMFRDFDATAFRSLQKVMKYQPEYS